MEAELAMADAEFFPSVMDMFKLRYKAIECMIEKIPGNLIVGDAWRALPLLFASSWEDAPSSSEIIHSLVNSHQSLYPDHEFHWIGMLIYLGRANAPTDITMIQNLLDVQQTLSPGYNINWDQVLRKISFSPMWTTDMTPPHASPETFCFLSRCSIAKRVNAIGVKHFRNAMADEWMGNVYNFDGQQWHTETLTKLEYYESEYRKLKESTSLLELALWKIKIDDSSLINDKKMVGGNKKIKMDLSEFRLQCRISCGADYVLENVWKYLLPPDYVRSYV